MPKKQRATNIADAKPTATGVVPTNGHQSNHAGNTQPRIDAPNETTNADAAGTSVPVKSSRSTQEIAAEYAERARQNRLHTVMFDDENEYLRFFDYAYEQYGGLGLQPTNVPIRTSLRVTTWLLNVTQDQFALRPVTDDDIADVRRRLRGQKPFDPASLEGLHIPGIPRKKRTP